MKQNNLNLIFFGWFMDWTLWHLFSGSEGEVIREKNADIVSTETNERIFEIDLKFMYHNLYTGLFTLILMAVRKKLLWCSVLQLTI